MTGPKAAGRYWWFEGTSVTTLGEYLGFAGPDARLEVRIDEGHHMTLHVVAGTNAKAIFPAINESHVCPPQCP